MKVLNDIFKHSKDPEGFWKFNREKLGEVGELSFV